MRDGLWIALLSVVACRAPALDLEGKACPCAAGYVCDASGGQCLPLGGAVEVANLRALWSTPNQIRWAWDTTGSQESFRDYQLVTAQSAADTEDGLDTARVWTVERNPELGRFFLPRTGGQDQTLATTTDLHEPATVYFARLIAIDTAGHASVSNTVSARTTDPPVGSISILDETVPSGYTIPDAPLFQLGTDRPFEGRHCFEYLVPPPCPETSPCLSDSPPTPDCDPCCPPGSTACWKRFRFDGLDLPLDAIGQSSFNTLAYLELAVASDASVPSYWSDVWLWYGDGSSDDSLWTHFTWTSRPDDHYRVLQVPLRVFAHHDDADQVIATTPFCQLAPHGDGACSLPSSGGLFSVSAGGMWTVGSKVRIDAIRIFY